MKTFKTVKQFTIHIVLLTFLISSCSEQRYTYYNIDKNKTAKVELVKPSAINSTLLKKNEKVPEHKEAEIGEGDEIAREKEEAFVMTKKFKKNTVAKKVTEAIDKTLTAPVETLTKVPEKVSTLFSKHKNTASLQQDGHRNLLWTIIAIVLILWLLGFLVGDLGSIIHLLLVVALILIILNLLGV